jgi:hypothetical protein
MWNKRSTGVSLGLLGGAIFGLLAYFRLNLTKGELIISIIILVVAIYLVYIFDGREI